MICGIPALAEADAALARSYSQAVGKSADSVALKQQQRDWRKARDACPDADCVLASYVKRSDELSR